MNRFNSGTLSCNWSKLKASSAVSYTHLCRLADLFDGVTVTAPTMGAIIAILLAVLLLYASGFVSASEIAFFSLSPVDLSEIEEGKHTSDRRISALLNDSERRGRDSGIAAGTDRKPKGSGLSNLPGPDFGEHRV